jgi:primosomal replication protein N
LQDREINRLLLTAHLTQRAELRYTPAGLAVLDMRLAHSMTQSVEDVSRQIKLDIAAQAFEEVAHGLIGLALGTQALFQGFLHSSRGSRPSLNTSSRAPQAVFHVETFEPI